jgi:type I restriction enzyme R subunit
MPQKNLAVELLRKLLNNEIKLRSKKFLIQSKSFAELLENSIRKYQNRAIETAQVIEELIQLAKEMRQGRHARQRTWLEPGRSRVLRRAGNQRQRRQGVGR